MTEAEWLSCTDPKLMLDYLNQRKKRGSVRERSLILFACACCRRLGSLIPDGSCWWAIEIAERYADGRATEEERKEAWLAVVTLAEEEGVPLYDDYRMEPLEWGRDPGGWLVYRAIQGLVGVGAPEVGQVAEDVVSEISWDAARIRSGDEAMIAVLENTGNSEQKTQCQMLRDIIPNPFKPPFLDLSWLHWQCGTIPRLAQVSAGAQNRPVMGASK
jgi:hypothetical protein